MNFLEASTLFAKVDIVFLRGALRAPVDFLQDFNWEISLSPGILIIPFRFEAQPSTSRSLLICYRFTLRCRTPQAACAERKETELKYIKKKSVGCVVE